MDTLEERPLRTKQAIKNKTMKERFKNIKENITVEPIVACYTISMLLIQLATSNLHLDKACRVNMKYGDEICDALISKKGEMYLQQELAIQKIIAPIDRWRNIILNVVPMLCILFLGAWSDRTGNRKLCILLPLSGLLAVTVYSILIVYYYEWPVEVTMYIQAIFYAFTGGWITIYMGAFTYVTNITSEESRTLRLGIVHICVTTGGPIGYVLAGILLNKTGYYGAFLVSFALTVFAITYGCIFVKNPEPSTIQNVTQSTSVWDFIKSFFHITHVTDTLKVVIKNEPKGRRTKSILILISILFVVGPYEGEDVVRYLFTRYCFNWDAQMYSYWNFFYVGIHTLGAMISVIWFSRHLKWDDSVLGIISSTSKIIGSITVALATSTRDMYIAVVLETLNATAFTVLRSALTKLCSNDELGRVTSVFNLLEMAGSLTFGTIYSTIYLHTISIDARIIYYASAAFTVIPLVVFGWFYVQHRKTRREYKRTCIEDLADPS